MACLGSSFIAFEALPLNQALPKPAALYSQAPVNCQELPSQTSTQLWLPHLFAHIGVPTKREGTPTERQAAIRSTESPVHEANPASIDS